MSTTTTSTALDIEALARAIEQRDAEGQLAAYADDAVLTVVDSDHPPSRPTMLRGRDAIAAHLRDVCRRDLTHRVEHAVAAGDRAALTVACEYPDGTRVLCAATLVLDGGRVTRQRTVQAWDA